MRIRNGFIAAGVVSMFLVSGCGGKGNEVVNYETPIHVSHSLQFLGNKVEAENVEVIEDIITGFMTEHPDVRVSYESIKGTEYYKALRKRELSGNLDDIFVINNDTGLDFTAHGSLLDISELVEKVPFTENMLSQMEFKDGNIYWAPLIVSAFGLYCNRDLLEHYRQQVPKNLEEWEAVCDSFLSKGITPIIANNDISLKTLAIAKGFYPTYKEGNQSDVFQGLNSGEDEVSSYLEDGFSLVKAFCEKGYIDAKQALVTEKTSDDLEEFIKAESPFMLTGVWAAGRMKKMEPDFEFQVVPYLVLENGSVLVENPDVCLGVSALGGEKKLAKEFVSYFLKEENLNRFADNQSSFSPLEGKQEPALIEIQPIVKQYKNQISVNGKDSHLRFPLWDITNKLLSGTNVSVLMKRLDERVSKSINTEEVGK